MVILVEMIFLKLCCHKYGHHLGFEGQKVANLSFAKLYVKKNLQKVG
jgi:hypothetical protein